MTAILFIPTALCGLMTFAHFVRFGDYGTAAAILLPLPLLLLRGAWVRRLFQLLLPIAALFWANIGTVLVLSRLGAGEPFLRLAIILGSVCALCLAAVIPFYSRRLAARFCEEPNLSPVISGLLVFTLLGIVQHLVTNPMLLMERFFPGSGWFQVTALSIYAALATQKLMETRTAARWRKRIWLLFSIVFFSQLALGIVGFDEFLMTGDLHLPVPAVILAGPVYRAEGFFMLVLFASTVLLVGPAWCSHLCYIGAVDQLAATMSKKPVELPAWTRKARWLILAGTIVAALILRSLDVPAVYAALFGLAFGVVGVTITITASRRLGVMTHCVVWCPLGLVANLAGRLSPFRIAFSESCNGCGACAPSCRFDALRDCDIERRRPSMTCTLCGDCVSRCSRSSLEYRFAGRRGAWVRPAFIVLSVVLHTACLGVARI